MNLPRDADRLKSDPCPLATECVVSAIEQDLGIWRCCRRQARPKRSGSRPSNLGDIHQPLHVSFEDDRGGNEIGVSGGLCSWNLHAVWDRCIIEQGLPGDPYTLAQQLLDEVTDEDRATWHASSPIDWAHESFAISTGPKLEYCIRTDAGCWYEADNERLDAGEPEKIVAVDRPYVGAHTSTVRGRLVKAGVRLGGLLNWALGERPIAQPAE